MKRNRKLLVIGGVAAGTKAAAKARRDDPSMEITIITKEEYISYAGCGLAYYVGGIVESRNKLFARSPEVFREKYNITVLLKHHADRIDTYDQVVHITDLTSGKTFTMQYDCLLLATGASPVVPKIDGIEMEGVFTLHTIPDADRMKEYLQKKNVRKASIIGGGYIGIEMAENLMQLGLSVTIFEIADNLTPRMFDPGITSLIQEHLESKGVHILTGTTVEKFTGDSNNAVHAVVAGGKEYESELVVLAAGVRPSVTLAREARLTLGHTGAIRVDKRMETSVRNIFAAGDCAESTHLVSGKPVWFPLGSTANKQGRVAGANIAGGKITFPGVLGTSLVKVFDLAAGRTGLNDMEAVEAGFNPLSVTVTTPVKAGYYPGGGKVTLKLTADHKSGKLLGAQSLGDNAVDKIIDTVAAALTGKISVPDLTNLDLTYAPPYSLALGTVIVAASVLEGKL